MMNFNNEIIAFKELKRHISLLFSQFLSLTFQDTTNYMYLIPILKSLLKQAVIPSNLTN